MRMLVPTVAMTRGFDGPEPRSVFAERVGPFAIYSDADLYRAKHKRGLHLYHVTHAATGYSCARHANKDGARKIARAFARCGIDWDFTTPEHVKSWPKDWVKKVRQIRSDNGAFKPLGDNTP